MSTTPLAQMGNSLPSSSDLKRDPWVGADPDQLIREGYTESIDLAPKQAQSNIESGTNSASTNDVAELTPTAPASNHGLIKQLRTPDPTTEAPHWVTMHALQEWEGYVLEKGEGEFVARLMDITVDTLPSHADIMPEEEAIIPLSEISNDDIRRLYPGSIFRWVIGYERSASGTKRRISQIVFRDLPAMTRQDKTEGREWARKVVRLLGH